MAARSQKQIAVPDNIWCGNAPITVEELEKLLPELRSNYGAAAVISFDAGHNNVTVMVRPAKKQQSGR